MRTLGPTARAIIVSGVLLLAAVPSAAAATWTVNTTTDAAASPSECSGVAGDCSLRQAVDKAASGDTITLPAGTYDLSSSLPEISLDKSVTISGAGARTTTVASSGETGIFNDDDLSSSGTVTISGVTMSGGMAGGPGGALDLSSGGTFNFNDDAFSDDTATGGGGAIEVTNLTVVNITDSAVGPGDTATTNGGGIDNDGGTLTVSNSTVSDDSAADGGGISSEGTTGAAGVGVSTLEFATVAFNTASTTGGDLFSSDDGGDDPAPVDISDSVVADGGAPTGNDCNANAGGFDGEYNVTDSIASTGTAGCGFTGASDALADARLGGLADNGGQTNTIALAAGSPAIGLIPAADCTGADQRGNSRTSGGNCDAGALEAGGGETAPQWSVSHDFRTSPQANPSPDSLGNPDVWYYDETPLADVGTPADYTQMTSSGESPSCSNLYVWGDPSGFPDLGLNAGTSTDVCFTTATYPAHSLIMSPATDAAGIVAWKSPVSGKVSVAGSFLSLDSNAGDGTTWEVYDGSTKLASGVNDVGGSGIFDQQSLSVSSGDTLYFVLGPSSGNDASYDTTEFNLTITGAAAAPPPSADLSLAAQAQPNPVTVGQTLDDTFTVTNDGPDQAAAVSLSDTLPNGDTLQSVIPSQGSCSGTSTITCALGSIADGAHGTVSVEVTPTQAGTNSNTASVSSTTADPDAANNTATATATVNPGGGNGGCANAMTLGTIQVLADCISSQGDGTYLASGDTRFTNGTSIVDAGTNTPATLVLNTTNNTISIAPASGGGAQPGELEAGGRDVATGDLVIDTQGVQDPVSGRSDVAMVGGVGSVDLSLSGWPFGDNGVSPTVYLAPSSTGGGAIVDGRLTLPAWLGPAIAFGTLTTNVPALSGQLAMQVNSSGAVSVLNGGLSFKSSLLGIPALTLTQGQITYQGAGDLWTGTTLLGFPGFQLGVDVTIGQGKLDDLSVNFACGTSGNCSGQNVQAEGPHYASIGAVLDLKDAALQVINLQGISYTPFSFLSGRPSFCNPRFSPCPPSPPPPQIDGQIIAGALGDKVIAGGGFSYLLDGAFSASGTVGLAPLFGHTFPYPAALQQNQQAVDVVNTLLKSANTGVELAGATVDFTPPSLLQATGTVYLPPPPFPFQFLKGTISLGIDPPHFTGEGSLDLVIPGYVPIIGGDTIGGVEGLISDKGAAAQVSIPSICVPFLGCTPNSILVAFNYQTGGFTWDIGGGNINDFATVPQASASSARGANRRTVSIPGGKQLASITVRSARGVPHVVLIGPARAGRRHRFTLSTSRGLHNRSGALVWVDRAKHFETFLVLAPRGGRWTLKRLRGPRIVSVSVVVPRHKLPGKHSYPHATERARDLPKGIVWTTGHLTLHYRVPHHGARTTVDLWAGTGPHGAGGVMIADGLRPSGAATWNLSGLAPGRYWPYAIVNENGVPVSIQYWPRSVEIADPAAPAAPTAVDATQADGGTWVGWTPVGGAAVYGLTATRIGGGAPVVDAVPASQLTDLLTLPRGRWSITVQAYDSSDRASLPSAATDIKVP